MDEEKTVARAAETGPSSEPEGSAGQAAENTPTPKPRRRRRTKAQIEEDAKKAAATAKREAKKAAKAAEKAVGGAIETVREDMQAAAKRSKAKIPAPNVILQYAGNEIDASTLAEAAVAQFRAEEKRTKITDFKLYVKPEERAAYFVINGGFTGKVEY